MTKVNNHNQKVFAYLRKSTKKKNQEQSIEKQKGAISVLASSLNIDLESIEYFIDEGYSGYKGIVHISKNKYTRQRKDFTRLLNTVRKVKEPCKVLVYDYTRLTRNIEDYTEISKLLGVNNRDGKKIEGVYFHNGNVWNIHTKQGDMINNVLDSLKYSEKISDNVSNAYEFSLKKGILPKAIKCPKGLENTGKILKEGEKMQFIRKAFEMKAEGSSNKDILRYLKRNKVIVGSSHIATTLFKNRAYIGEYTLPSTGEIFNIKFYKNKKPISLKLFNKANDNIGVKKGKYGNKQKDDLLANLLKTEDGKKFSMYIPKNRKAKQYSNDVDKLYLSQRKVFDEFEEIINRIFFLHYKIFVQFYFTIDIKKGSKEIEDMFKGKDKKFIEKIKQETILKQSKEIEEMQKEFGKISFDEFVKDKNYVIYFRHIYFLYSISKEHSSKEFIEYLHSKEVIENVLENLKDLYINFGLKYGSDSVEDLLLSMKDYKISYNKSYKVLKDILLNNGNKEFDLQQEENQEVLKDLEKQKDVLENKLQEAKNGMMFNGFTKQEIQEAIKKPLEDIEFLNEEISEIQNNSLDDKDLDRFIEAIQKIFEHISNMHNKAVNKVSEEDFLYLIKMITFELVFDSKKELKIKLFRGIDNLLYANGTPTENRTPVTGMRIPGPNH